MLATTIKEAYSIDAAITNSHNLHRPVTEKLQSYTDLKEEVTRIRHLKTACTLPLVLSASGIISNKSHESLKPLNLRPAPCILMQKAVTLNTCRTVRMFFAEQRVRCDGQ
jgi:hypothetical protein